MKSFAELNFPGRLIAVEGLDGSGKSTQIYLLKRWLEAEGIKVYFSEWNSSKIVKSATSKGKKRELLTPTTFSLIHATDFADQLENIILPALKAGFIVLADRYIYTLMARDMVRGMDEKWLKNLYGIALEPDAVFYLSVEPEELVLRPLPDRGAIPGQSECWRHRRVARARRSSTKDLIRGRAVAIRQARCLFEELPHRPRNLVVFLTDHRRVEHARRTSESRQRTRPVSRSAPLAR